MYGVDIKLLQLLEFYAFNIYVNAVAVSNNIDVAPKCYFSGKLSTARPGAVKESILLQTGCLHYGRHDIFTFFQNAGQYYQKLLLSTRSVVVSAGNVLILI